jgi:hypothetical protein
MAIRIVNLTPHTIDVVGADGCVRKSYPSEGVARAVQDVEAVGVLDGVELVRMTFGRTEGLPDPSAGTYYIVSIITASAASAQGRSVDDLIIAVDSVRDEDGRIIGCMRFSLV